MRRPRYTIDQHVLGSSSVHVGIYTAIRIADAYRFQLPTVQQLQDQFGMSRATAYRWRASLRGAREIPSD